MADFGGMGGVWGGRERDLQDAFETAVAAELDLSDIDLAYEMWGALANQPWQHESGDTASYSFRAAGDLVAAVRGVAGEDYLKFYCMAPEEVTERIAEAMARAGWRPLSDEGSRRYWDWCGCASREADDVFDSAAEYPREEPGQ